jgi:hypothetical protein
MKISRVKAPRYNGGWKVAKIDTIPALTLQECLSLGSSSSPSNKIPLGLHGNNNNHNNNKSWSKKKKGKIYTRDARAQELASGNKTFLWGSGGADWMAPGSSSRECVCVRGNLSARPGTLSPGSLSGAKTSSTYIRCVPSQVAEEFRFFFLLLVKEGKRNRNKKGPRDGLMRNC